MRRGVAVDLPPLRNSPRVSAGSATLNVVTGNNDVNDNNDASVYIPVRTVGQRHGPCVGHGMRSSYAAWRPPASAWRPMIRAFSGRCPGVSVTIRAAFTSRDVVGLVRTGAAELGLFVTSGPITDKKVIPHAAGEQRFVATTTSHSYPATASASRTPPCTRERRGRVHIDAPPAKFVLDPEREFPSMFPPTSGQCHDHRVHREAARTALTPSRQGAHRGAPLARPMAADVLPVDGLLLLGRVALALDLHLGNGFLFGGEVAEQLLCDGLFFGHVLSSYICV